MTRDALVCTVALALLLGSSAGDQRASLNDTAARYRANIAAIAPIAGRDTAFDYYERLRDDADQLDDRSVPDIARVAALDRSLATQLIDRSFGSISSIRGFGEAFVRSSRDGTMQPVAVYVPSAYRADRPAPLIVLLHGRPQSETQLLAPDYIARLAERTGTIVVAPWGRGYYDFRGSGADVYDAARAATVSFAIDPRKRFLAGYSMGGFSVFEVAPLHPAQWSAVMCIAGALLGSDSRRFVELMRTTPIYVLTGSADDSIPTHYPTSTAEYLRSAGLAVSYYSLSGGTHRLATLLPILTLAWDDMLHEVVRTPPPALGNIELPSSIPMSALKP